MMNCIQFGGSLGGVANTIVWLDALARETMLFASVGILIGGADDLLTDVIHGARRVRWRLRGESVPDLSAFPAGNCTQRLAVFVPAWDESAVIGIMLRTALARFDHPDFRIYAGAYPNDSATMEAINAVAAADDRLRLVVCPRAGPTTKADCLNAMWRAMLADGLEEERPFTGVVLHDAEDVVHAGELRLLDHWLASSDTVQLPVLPLPDRDSRWVGGHYADEFAEAHRKLLPVRQFVGAGMPLAGVGCAVSVAMLARVAELRGGTPFDEASLTEDYELGLTVAALGGRGVFVHVPESPGGPPVAVRAYFPGTLGAAVRQKSRWMVGIALAGWDRIGWDRPARLGDHWMRMRDRRTMLSILVLAAAYVALVSWGVSELVHLAVGRERPPFSPEMRALLLLNASLLAWRLATRAFFVTRAYGWREGVRSVPRTLVGNLVALLAARRAIFRYVSGLRGKPLTWDKTAHTFPVELAEGASA